MGRPERDAARRGARGAAASEEVLQRIFQDMLELSDADLASLRTLTQRAGGRKSLEQVALEEGYITAEQRDGVLRVYLERQLAEMRGRLIGARIGSYHIIEEIACGGMGIVFRARQESPMFTRDVALKLMIAGASATEEEREQFITEVKGLAGLSHPGLVHLLDSGIQDGLYYFSMELVDGWSLAGIPGDAALPLTRKVEIVRDIALALEYLHSRGVVHRDVKPGNVMVDKSGVAKLLDFGIAQFSADPRFRAVQAGTPYFMAPEVIDPSGEHGAIGPSTDIYSLGAVLYQLLLGRPVFASRRGDLGEVLRRTLQEPPSFPRTRRERIPAALERILSRCLSKDAGDRYPTAAALAGQLDGYLRRSRHRAPIWAAASLLVGAVIIGFLSGREPTHRPEPPDLRPWRARVAEVEEVDAAAAQGPKQRLERIRALPPADGAVGEEVIRLGEELGAAWKEIVRQAEVEAAAAKAEYLGIPVPEDGRAAELFGEGTRSIEQAQHREPDRTAFQLLATASRSFKEARALAEAEKSRRQRETWRQEAETASEEARRQEHQLEEEGKIGYSDEAQAAREKGRQQCTLAAERFAAGNLQAAKALYVEAQESFNLAWRRARAGFDDACRRLGTDLEQAEGELQRHRPRLEKNLPGSVLEGLLAPLEKARNALQERLLLEGVASLAAFRDDVAAARASVDELERRALEARDRVRDVATGETLPACAAGSLGRARRSLARGRTHLERDELEAAREAFAEAAKLIARIREQAAHLTAGMVWLEAGEGEPGLWVDRCEVSVRDFEAFLKDVEARGHGSCCPDGRQRAHTPLDWREQKRAPDAPVVGVPLEEARAFASWRGKELPTEALWRRAAMAGPDGRSRAYPYGDRFDARRTNGDGDEDGFPGLAPVSSLPAGAGACGCLHLSGNAAEWALLPAGGGVLLGGSYLTAEPSFLRGDARHVPLAPLEREASARRTAGFRCVLRALTVQTAGEVER